ncbi:hypothetical protein [Anatilimnocola floriformis]|uniref:hypothetical protein n=1 Tax=Anatilimnocola floriformis TaxID=2948575 RepID=UPI0020C35BC2|nr:hypothetical protein [Anatilimnocola floriformis]
MKFARASLSFALRYSPLAIMVLLAVGWYFSLTAIYGWRYVGPERSHSVFFRIGSLRYIGIDSLGETPGFKTIAVNSRGWEQLGEFEFVASAWMKETIYDDSVHPNVVSIPIPWLLTLLLPLAVGPLVRYRFPLWSWFVMVAIVGAETAFYGRTIG